MNYTDGTEIRVGDRVRHREEGAGTVVDVTSDFPGVNLDSGIAGAGAGGSWSCCPENLTLLSRAPQPAPDTNDGRGWIYVSPSWCRLTAPEGQPRRSLCTGMDDAEYARHTPQDRYERCAVLAGDAPRCPDCERIHAEQKAATPPPVRKGYVVLGRAERDLASGDGAGMVDGCTWVATKAIDAGTWIVAALHSRGCDSADSGDCIAYDPAKHAPRDAPLDYVPHKWSDPLRIGGTHLRCATCDAHTGTWLGGALEFFAPNGKRTLIREGEQYPPCPGKPQIARLPKEPPYHISIDRGAGESVAATSTVDTHTGRIVDAVVDAEMTRIHRENRRWLARTALLAPKVARDDHEGVCAVEVAR